MTFRYWNAGVPTLSQLRQEVDRLVSGVASVLPDAPWFGSPSRPALNVWEEGDGLKIEAELPGVQNEHVEVSVAGGEMSLKVERPEVEQADVTYHRRERPVGTFTRVLRLPFEVDAERVQADLKDGVLTITLPKSAAAKPRKIVVKAG